MPPVTDPAVIRALLETDRAWAVYPLGDLAPQRFSHCTWLRAAGGVPALALIYRAFTPPVLFTLGRPDAVEGLLAEVNEKEFYLHVRPDVLPLLRARFHVRDTQTMWRMVLDPPRFRPPPPAPAVRLGPEDVPALLRLFADGEPDGEAPHFFLPSMLEDGAYFGVREGEDLIAAAGTHLVEPAEGVAAVGNVYTRRDRRGRGLASRVTSGVAADLLARGLRTIALNVDQRNVPAIHIYERLGFARYCAFLEGSAGAADRSAGSL